MTNKTVDWTKPIQTKDGQPARVICTDRKNTNHPVLVLIDKGDDEYLINVTKDGFYLPNKEDHIYNISNTTKKKSTFINLYKNDKMGVVCHSLEQASDVISSHHNYIGTLKINYENSIPISVELIKP